MHSPRTGRSYLPWAASCPAQRCGPPSTWRGTGGRPPGRSALPPPSASHCWRSRFNALPVQCETTTLVGKGCCSRWHVHSEQRFFAVETVARVPPHLPYRLDDVRILRALVPNILEPVAQHSGQTAWHMSAQGARHLFSRMLARICSFSLSVMPPKCGSLAYMWVTWVFLIAAVLHHQQTSGGTATGVWLRRTEARSRIHSTPAPTI